MLRRADQRRADRLSGHGPDEIQQEEPIGTYGSAEREAMELVRPMAEGRAPDGRRWLKRPACLASSACGSGCERHASALRPCEGWCEVRWHLRFVDADLQPSATPANAGWQMSAGLGGVRTGHL
jgi:hypothetical protein